MSAAQGEHARLFLAAMQDAHKAWAQTPMLARVQASQARHVCATLAGSDALAIAELIGDMAGPAVASYSVRTNMDADKVRRLSALVMQMLVPACIQKRELGAPGITVTERALTVCQALRTRLLCWIDSGSCDGAPALSQVDELIGHRAEIRLGLVAPAAPVLAHCEIVARAIAEGYPFMSGRR